MSRPNGKPDIAPVVDLPPLAPEAALAVLCASHAVRKVRISTRGGYRFKDTATGEVAGESGPVLVLFVNEALLKQGW